MSQLITYNSVNDGVTSRRYTGYPLNSTLVSSYTPDTIRSIINHAATGQPYSTTVWIRINRVGIQISAQDPQIARTRVPVFIPITLVHDIFMLPSINNVICIVYDELQSNMKGVLLYVVHPSDAQLLRDDFRIVKQASSTQQAQQQQQPPYSSPFDNMYPPENTPVYTPLTSKSPLSYEPYRNNANTRQQSPRRILYNRENEGNKKPNVTPTLLSITHAPYKGSYHSDKEEHGHQRRHKSPKKHRTSHSPSKRPSDSAVKQRKYRSRSPEKQAKMKLPVTSNSLELTPEQIQQQQLLIQQQQMAAWQQANQQQMPFIPMGIYNRYVPKTIPLPTGETLKTTLPTPSTNGVTTNGAAMAYIEPQDQVKPRSISRSSSRSRSPSPPRHNQAYHNRSNSAQTGGAQQVSRHHHHHHHHRRHQPNGNANGNAYVSTRPDTHIYSTVPQPSRSRSKYTSTANNNNNNYNNNSSETEDETKQYLKLLIDEMQAMKLEMNRMRQVAGSTPKGRSDSIQADIKDLRSHIDMIRARIAMTPKVPNK